MNGTGLFDLKNEAPNETLKVLEKYGSRPITKIEVKRRPIFKNIDRIANWISKGEWDNLKKLKGYDDIYHLYMVVSISNGPPILIEKNEIVRTKDNFTEDLTDTQVMPVPMNYETTLYSMFEKAENILGVHLWNYSASKYNCQNFIYTMLSESGLMNLTLENFIMQDPEELFKTLPGWAARISDSFTNVAGWYHKMIGTGVGEETLHTILVDKHQMSIPQAKKWLKTHGYIYPKIRETKNYYRFRQREPDYSREFTTRAIGDHILGVFQYG